MLSIEKAYLDRLVQKPDWCISNVFIGNLAGSFGFLLMAVLVALNSKGRQDESFVAFALLAAPLALRLSYLGWLARRRKNDLTKQNP